MKTLIGNGGWSRVDRFMRAGHLYTGLFLVPWMAVYATSAFCLNHNSWFTPWLGKPQPWETVREVRFAADAADQDPERQARAVLQAVDLDGPHRIQGQSTTNELVLYRVGAGGDYLVTWRRSDAQITVQQQRPLSIYRYLHFLHFIRGNEYRYGATIAWAVTVDIAAFSTWFWIVSGIYIWARRPKNRIGGGICLVGGGLLFVVLAILICR
jgi:hypothetical protein